VENERVLHGRNAFDPQRGYGILEAFMSPGTMWPAGAISLRAQFLRVVGSLLKIQKAAKLQTFVEPRLVVAGRESRKPLDAAW